MQGLEGLRISKCAIWFPPRTALNCLLGLGADVIKLGLPDGDEARRRRPFLCHRPDPNTAAYSSALTLINVASPSIRLQIAHTFSA